MCPNEFLSLCIIYLYSFSSTESPLIPPLNELLGQTDRLNIPLISYN